MQTYKCPYCGLWFSEVDKAWDTAIKSGLCPECRSQLTTFPNQPNNQHLKTDPSIVQSQKRLYGVGGWLKFLVIQLAVLGPLVGAAQLFGSIQGAEIQNPILINSSDWERWKTVTWWTFGVIICISFYGAWGLATGKDITVVKRAKAVLWIIGPLGCWLMWLVIPSITSGTLNATTEFWASLISSVISASIWTAYLSKSRRVCATFSERTNRTTENSVGEQEPSARPFSTSSFQALEDRFYKLISDELEQNTVDRAIWTKAYAQCSGDDKQTRSLYIQTRFARLLAEEKAKE
jgi:hypothetical protein